MCSTKLRSLRRCQEGKAEEAREVRHGDVLMHRTVKEQPSRLTILRDVSDAKPGRDGRTRNARPSPEHLEATAGRMSESDDRLRDL